jgi:hypothetical protein
MNENALAVSNKLHVTIPKSATKYLISESQPCMILVVFSLIKIFLRVYWQFSSSSLIKSLSI